MAFSSRRSPIGALESALYPHRLNLVIKSEYFRSGAARLSTTSSKGGAFLSGGLERKNTINDFLLDDPDYVASQEALEDDGYMKPFSSDRKTVIADDTGLNEIIIEGNH